MPNKPRKTFKADSPEQLMEWIAGSGGSASKAVSQPEDVGIIDWVEELAQSWERRGKSMINRRYTRLAELVLAQSFKERAEELRRAYAESPSTEKLSRCDEKEKKHGTT